MFNIGTQELLLILLVVLIFFGAKRIPEVSRSLGKGVADIRDALSGVERELKGEPPVRPRILPPPGPSGVDRKPFPPGRSAPLVGPAEEPQGAPPADRTEGEPEQGRETEPGGSTKP